MREINECSNMINKDQNRNERVLVWLCFQTMLITMMELVGLCAHDGYFVMKIRLY